MVGGLTVGDPPQAQDRHHVVDTQRAAVLHVGAQQLDKRLIGAGSDHVRVHRRQTPVLTQRAKNIRWRADRGFQTVKLAIAPGLCPALGDTHRQVTVQANRHVVALTLLPAGGKLTVGQPLQPEVEIDLVGVLFAKRFYRRGINGLVLLGPYRPAPAHFVLFHLICVQRIKGRLPVKALPFPGNKLPEGRHLFVVTLCKVFPRHAQRSHFQRGDGSIIDPLGIPGALQRLPGSVHLPPGLRLGAVTEILNGVYVDINHVQPATG